MNSIYIHIPFCNRICSYCDFVKIYTQREEEYIDKLIEEIKTNYDNSQLVETVFIGGGTPSALSKELLDKLLSFLHDYFSFTENYEYTIENNPESLTHEKLDIYKKYGINRISLGVQTTNERLLEIIERDHKNKHVLDIVNYAKKIGISNISIDLMFSLPTQTIDDIKNDINFFVSLGINHLSYYSLILEQRTKFNVFRDKYEFISENLEYKMQKFILEEMDKLNYVRYEISNFSISEEYNCLHNVKCWENKEYYGFGLGAHGFVNGIRYENEKNINSYLKNKDHILNKTIISREESCNESIFLGLRMTKGINIEEINARHDIDFRNKYKDQIDFCISNKLAEIKDNWFKLTDKGIMYTNDVLVKFL